MKYIILIVLAACSFGGGVYFENNRLVGEPDTTIAVMLSKQAKDNSVYLVREFTGSLKHLQNNELLELEKKLRRNIENQKEMGKMFNYLH